MSDWLEQWGELCVATTRHVHEQLKAHLLREDRQEDLCFAVWRPSSGTKRGIALLERVVLPREGERNVHGNVDFESEYLLRAAEEASIVGGGLALLHSHPGSHGWQGLSDDDFAAESRNGGLARSLTGLPMLGLPMAGTGEMSARFWYRAGPREYLPTWCESVRVVGGRLFMTYNPKQRGWLPTGPALVRTISAWGPGVQADLARLRVGVVGLGSVGAIVAEGIARMGVQRITQIDFDTIEEVNRDRLIHARESSRQGEGQRVSARGKRHSRESGHRSVRVLGLRAAGIPSGARLRCALQLRRSSLGTRHPQSDRIRPPDSCCRRWRHGASRAA